MSSNRNEVPASVLLAQAVLAYDAAIQSCANDPERMASFCTAEGDSLDALYFTMVTMARETTEGTPPVVEGIDGATIGRLERSFKTRDTLQAVFRAWERGEGIDNDLAGAVLACCTNAAREAKSVRVDDIRWRKFTKDDPPTPEDVKARYPGINITPAEAIMYEGNLTDYETPTPSRGCTIHGQRGCPVRVTDAGIDLGGQSYADAFECFRFVLRR